MQGFTSIFSASGFEGNSAGVKAGLCATVAAGPDLAAGVAASYRHWKSEWPVRESRVHGRVT